MKNAQQVADELRKVYRNTESFEILEVQEFDFGEAVDGSVEFKVSGAEYEIQVGENYYGLNQSHYVNGEFESMTFLTGPVNWEAIRDTLPKGTGKFMCGIYGA